jgi:hypothetical protein
MKTLVSIVGNWTEVQPRYFLAMSVWCCCFNSCDCEILFKVLDFILLPTQLPGCLPASQYAASAVLLIECFPSPTV